MTGFNAGSYDEPPVCSVHATQLVNNWVSPRAASTLSLPLNGASTPLTITHGEQVTVNASATGSKGTPSGVVGLVDSINHATMPAGLGLDEFTLNSRGVATGSVNNLPGGSYTVSARYSGSPAYAEVPPTPIPVMVAPKPAPPSSALLTQDPIVSANHQFSYGFYSMLDAQPYGSSSPKPTALCSRTAFPREP